MFYWLFLTLALICFAIGTVIDMAHKDRPLSDLLFGLEFAMFLAGIMWAILAVGFLIAEGLE